MTVPLFFLLCSDGENRVWSSLYIDELFRYPEGVDLASQASYMAHMTLKIIWLRIKQRHLPLKTNQHIQSALRCMNNLFAFQARLQVIPSSSIRVINAMHGVNANKAHAE